MARVHFCMGYIPCRDYLVVCMCSLSGFIKCECASTEVRLSYFQVNQLLQVAQKCQAGATESGSAGGSNQDLQSSCNMWVDVDAQC